MEPELTGHLWMETQTIAGNQLKLNLEKHRQARLENFNEYIIRF